MQQIWNDFELKKPPYLTLPIANTKFVIELHGLIDIYVSKLNAHEEEFAETAALLGRLMARRKNSFRKMKGFKEFCKLNAALCRLLRVDFKRDLNSFRSTLPDVEYDEGILVHVPTRDNFDFLLLRLIAIRGLYQRIVDCCIESAEHFTTQLRAHYFFEINTLLVAVLAKVYCLSIKLGNLAINLYNELRGYRLKLPVNIKSKFVINSDDIPSKLELIAKSNMEDQKLETAKNVDTPVKQTDLCDILTQENSLPSPTLVKATCLKKADIGTHIERSEIKSKKVFDIDKLKTVADIKKFILDESKSRIKNSISCITKQILSHEWSGATKLFERKLQKGEQKKAINIFKKFIGSKM